MIKHNFYVNVSDTRFDNTLNDNVFTYIIFYFVSHQEENGNIKTVSTQYQIDLPNPDPNNFVPCKDADMAVRRQWVQNAIASIEQKLIDVNLTKLQLL